MIEYGDMCMEPDEFANYIRHTTADRKEAAWAWATAIGLQQVDGLPTSDHLRDTARRNIEGEISIDEAERIIRSYYLHKSAREEVDSEEHEGDVASVNIGRLLQEPGFTFSRAGLQNIHKRIFSGIYKFAGRFRDFDISKKEWVLRGDSVLYGSCFELQMAVDYDIAREKEFRYAGLSADAVIEHLAEFISGLWQIHPFQEGNTRTSAVFLIKYLRQIGFKAENDLFERHSWYFRNALVRANYRNVAKGIEPDISFLVAFLRNLLLGEQAELHNRTMLVGIRPEACLYGRTDQVDRTSTVQVDIDRHMRRLVEALGRDTLSVKDLMERMGLTHRPNFMTKYLKPAIMAGLVAPLHPESPRHPHQKYRLTAAASMSL